MVSLLVPAEEVEETRAYAGQLPSVQLSLRSACDLEILATGAFSPLDRFVVQNDYLSILETMRTANGYIFPIPVTLPIDPPSRSLWIAMSRCVIAGTSSWR